MKHPSTTTLSIAAVFFTLVVGVFGRAGSETLSAWQEHSPEKLVVHVEQAEKNERETDGKHYFDIRARLKVLNVIETATGLVAGDIIQVQYAIPNMDKTPTAGDWAYPVKKGKTYRAWLSGKKPNYRPDAASGSFEPVAANAVARPAGRAVVEPATSTARMPDYGKLKPPPVRTRVAVEKVLAGAPKPALKTRPICVVLVAGKKDHGPGEHDYPAWQKTWRQHMSTAEKTTIETAWDWPSDEQLKRADSLVFYQRGTWTAQRASDIDAFLRRGGGLVYIHYAVDGGPDAPGFAKRIGLAWQGGQSKFRHGPLDLGFDSTTDHPIIRNFDKVHFHDESYWKLTGDPKWINLLATAVEEDRPRPLFWTMQPSNGRVFVSIPGHYSWTFDDPLFRILLFRGIAWSVKEPVDRFNSLVMPGARVEEKARNENEPNRARNRDE